MLRYIVCFLCVCLLTSCSWDPKSGLSFENQPSSAQSQKDTMLSEDIPNTDIELESQEQEDLVSEIDASEAEQSLLADDESLDEYESLKFQYLRDMLVRQKSLSESEPGISHITDIYIPLLDGFPEVENPWKEDLKIPAPEMGFALMFFNTETGYKAPVWRVENLSMSNMSSIEGIDSYDLGAYFIGKIEIEREGEYSFSKIGGSQARVILDGKEIITETGNSEVKVYLKPGKYVLEAEYINNTHTTEFAVSYGIKEEERDAAYLSSHLSLDQDDEIWYVGTHEANNQNFEVIVAIPETDAKVSLILSSHSLIHWKIYNPFHTQIESIVYSNIEGITTVSGHEADTKVYKAKYNTFPVVYRILPSCRETAGQFYCEGSITRIHDLNEAVSEIYGKNITGFVGSYYGGEGFIVPGRVLDSAGYQKLEAEIQALQQQRDDYNNKKSFDTMFKSQ